MTENELSYETIGAAIEVHRELGGPGLIEDIYEEALEAELVLRGLKVRRQMGVKVHYKGKLLQKRLVLNMLVEDLVIIENKAVDEFHSIFQAKLLTYVRLTNKRLGLIINFGEEVIKDGIRRVVNKL